MHIGALKLWRKFYKHSTGNNHTDRFMYQFIVNNEHWSSFLILCLICFEFCLSIEFLFSLGASPIQVVLSHPLTMVGGWPKNKLFKIKNYICQVYTKVFGNRFSYNQPIWLFLFLSNNITTWFLLDSELWTFLLSHRPMSDLLLRILQAG